VKYAFIREHSHQHSLAALCRVLEVSRSGYYEWHDRRPSARVLANAELLEQIRQVHLQNRQAYGSKKTWQALRLAGTVCCKHRVARLRRNAGIEAQRKRRFRLTVEHQFTAPPAPNLIQRQFRVAQPNRVWVGDMTFVRTRAGFLYVAVLVDLYARRVVGWSMGARQDVELVLGALGMALEQRRPDNGLIHHSDQGSVYASRSYRDKLQAHGILASMSAKGNAYDNAVAESFFSNLKNELVHHRDFANRDEARSEIFDYIELFYNRKRLHQTLGYQTPEAFERRAASA
jgi:putative transposase